MKTIEERADEYEKIVGHSFCDKLEIKEVFSAGDLSERTELTRWNSPECPPEDDRDVLLKVRSAAGRVFYVVGFYESSGWNGYEMYLSQEQKSILGWREIHE